MPKVKYEGQIIEKKFEVKVIDIFKVFIQPWILHIK